MSTEQITTPEPRHDKPEEKQVWALLQLWDTDDLIAAIGCTRRGTWLAREMAMTLRGRGVDHKGAWVGFDRSAKIWRVDD